MRNAPELTTARVTQQQDTEAPVSEIHRYGAPTGKQVPGATLEAAVAWRDCYLLFMTDDVPFEEALGIHLLDAGLNLLDSATIGGPYTTGSFSSLRLEEPNLIHFRFIGDTDWRCELLPRPGFRIPFVSEPPGVSRPFGFSRRFIISGDPQPER